MGWTVTPQRIIDGFKESYGGETSTDKRRRIRKEGREKREREYERSASAQRPEQHEYAAEEGFLTAEAQTLEDAGLDDPRLFDKAKELRELSQGRAPMQPWEKDFRDRLNQAGRKLYAGAGLGGGNRAAQQRAIQMGLSQKAGDVENAILRAREQEQRVAQEELDNLLITARSAGKSAALALASQHQQWLTAQEQRNAAELSGIIGGLATLAGAVIMA